ncbi:MAG TPA: tyrosine-type recombinase/integrase [Kiritimatiellia bacterium]|nr:tyrosine-type recombinase/integrase [Kiritimatiellia bacterium]
MSEKTWPKVSRIRGGWRVDTGRGLPVRVRKVVATREAKDELVEALQAERKALRSTARFERGNRVVQLSGLDDAARRDVLAALDVLAGRGTLESAARFYIQHAAPASAIPCADLLDQYVEAIRAANRRPRTITDVEGKLRPFMDAHGKTTVQSITIQSVEGWLRKEGKARKWGPASRNAYRRALVGFFNFAIRRGFMERNPARAVEAVATDETMPDVFTVREVRRLLAAARREDARMLPYFLVGLFAGLRPENELRSLDWRDIDLEKKSLLVRPASAKKRRMRYVDLSDNAVEFLRPFAVEDGALFYSRVSFRRIVATAKVNWTRDVMRHTFASYHLAHGENAGATALQLGHHGDTAVLFAHYRNLVRREDAARYWNIRPMQSKVIPLRVSA